MTFREFRESGIDYGRKYKELMESIPGKGRGLENAVYTCYRQYKGFAVLRDIRESKVANKPMHYKVFDEAVQAYSNELVHFSVWTDKSYGKRSCISMYWQYHGHASFSPMRNDDNTIDWEGMDECDVDIVDPDDIERLYAEQVAMDKRLKQDIRDLVDRYSEERSKMPYLTESVYVRIG